MPTLEWIGKNKVVNHHQEVPFRVLERQYSFDEQGQHTENNDSENMIIHGDNLEALKALLPQYEGKVKCIYIVILTPILMSILSSENAQRVNQSKTYFTLDLLIGCYILQQEIQKTSRTDIQRMKIGITQTFPQWVKIIYNPPFNLKGWYDSNLKDDPRWADYETPPESNANYAWMEI